MNENTPSIDCNSALEKLDASWLEDPPVHLSTRAIPGLESGGEGDDLAIHLASCPACRRAADDMLRLDEHLRNGFLDLESVVASPRPGVVDETLRRVREPETGADLLRKIRRPVRVILWGAFYAFTLAASSVLAYAVYRVMLGS